MSDLFIETWGSGVPVVLVHGSLATGADEWDAQRPLAEAGYRLRVLDRRGYGRSPAAEGEDFLRDADDIAEHLGDGAHLVGHSYGGLGAMLAAARHPRAVLSLALLEPPALSLGQHDPAGRSLAQGVRRMWEDETLEDEEWLARFLEAVGTDPDSLPPRSAPPRCRSCRCSVAGGPRGEATCRSPRSRRRPTRSSSSPGDTAPASTPCVTTSRRGRGRREPWSRGPGTRSKPPAALSTRRC